MSRIASRGAERKTKDQIVGKIRIGSLNKLFAYRYGGCPTNCGWVFPDDDAGLEDLKILLHHYRFTFAHKMPQVMKLRAPWATDKVLEEVLAHPRKWRSERLGRLRRGLDYVVIDATHSWVQKNKSATTGESGEYE